MIALPDFRSGSISAEIRRLRHVRLASNNGLKSDVAALRIWANSGYPVERPNAKHA